MKKLVLLMLLIAAVAGFAADGRFEIKSIRLFTRLTPVPKYENETSASKAAKTTRWLCLETIFIPEALGGKTDQWYDDVTMEGMLVISHPGAKVNSYIVLTGKTRFFTIPADGKNHIGMFYVPAKILSRYLGTWNGDQPPVHMARVSFYAPGKVLLGEGFWARSSGKKGKFVMENSKEHRAAAARMKEYEKNYSNVTTLRGGLYSKEKTPWVYYNYDLYDLIYDNVLQQDSGSIKR